MKTGDVLTRTYAYQLERASWAMVGIGMLSQLDSSAAFPSYNLALGFWGLYCSFSRHGRATFGLIAFSVFAIILDIVFCSISDSPKTSTYKFCLAMLIFCLFLKLAVIYIGAHFFASLGGANSMDASNLTSSSVYEPLATSMENSQAAMYYPAPMGNSNSSFTNDNTNAPKPAAMFESV